MSAASSLLLSAWLTGAGAPSPAPDPDPSSLSGAEAHRAGLEAYEREDYDAAGRYFERAYGENEAPGDLYGWAQAMRSLGECEQAIALYEQFIALDLGGEAQRAAEQNIERCREQIAAAPPTVVEEPAPAPIVDVTPPEPTPPIDEPVATKRRRRVDPAGLTLTVLGGAAMVGGGIVLGLGESRRRTQADSGDYDGFDALDGGIDRMHIAGGAALGLGATLAVTGIVLWVVRHRARTTTAFGRRRGLARAARTLVPRVHWTRGAMTGSTSP
ncbi:MAG: hypothetical protein AAF799_22750 [Myxococcota bacterium]